MFRGSMRLMVSSAVLFACILIGCSSGPEQSSQPVVPTMAANGKVKFDDGSPVTAGMIEFVSVDGSGPAASAAIGNDGSFSLFTVQDNGSKTPGAKAGKYRVTVIPPQSEKQTEQPIVSSQEFAVTDGQNEFTVTIPKK